jgi:branched-chain amino acid transport system permease protein
VTISGLATGAIYALILAGILLVYQVSRAVNFAHGQVGMIAAFGSYYLYARHGWPVWIAVLTGMAGATLISALTYAVVLRHVKDRGGFDLIVTLGVLVLLTGLAQELFGGSNYRYLDLFNTDSFSVGDVFVNWNDLVVTGVTFALFAAAYLVLGRTTVGINVRASASDPAIAESTGIAVARTRLATWAVAGVLAAIAGVLLASRLSVDAFYMTPFLVNAFIAGILGGLDRLVAPLLIALGLGVYEGWCVLLFGSTARIPAIFLLVIVALSVLPRRFLEERQEARA